ncbi:MAG TPA: hypothetical protein VNH18_12705 [Bryobacteraceae bacterium]|jgi:hypothetical protein|nr:hypothetical protein [Bryobacteraceae bacterium]
MHDSSFSRFVEGGTYLLEGLGGFILFAGAEQLQVTTLQGVEPRFNAAVVQSFPGAASHAPFS